MITKISKKDKKDWEEFLTKKESLPNKDSVFSEKKIVSGDPETIKKIYDTWVFSRDTKSNNPNWQLVDTLT